MSEHASSDDDTLDGLLLDDGRPMTLEQEVAGESGHIAAFLDAPTDSLPLWEPTAVRDDVPAWNATEVAKLKELCMPVAPSSWTPDLGLYSIGHLDRLDPRFPATLDNFTRGDEHIFLSNAAGTGKTRLLAETLISCWGFYFTCCNGSGFNQYGSLDLADAISVLKLRPFDASGLYSRIILSRRMSAASLGELRHNEITARRPFLWVLLSRLLLFNEFCALYEARGIPEAQARRKWLLLQLRPKGVTRVDPFYHISTAIRDLHLDDDDLLSRIASAMHACQDRITFVAIDEAQVPQTRFETSFATANPDRLQHAPLLRELIKCFAEHLPHKRFIISSHCLDLSLVSEALSAAHARTSDVRHFYALGSVETIAQAASYIRHFVSDASDSDCRLIFVWARGRYRFLALAVMLILMFGARNIASVVHALLFALGDFDHPGSTYLRDQYYFKVAQSIPVFGYKTLDDSDDRIRMALRRATLDYALHGALHPMDEQDRVPTVRLNAGFFDGVSAVRVFEPIVVLRLARWMQKSKVAGIHGVIRRKLEDNNFNLATGAFYDGFVALVWETLRSGPLDRWLNFPGLRPSWTQHGAALILPRFRHRRQPFATCDRDTRPSSLLGFARTSDDVFSWLNNASQPFLVPDEGFGAELLFMLDLHGGDQVLVTVHTKFSDRKRTRRDLRVVPPRPDELYKNSPEDNERLVDLLSKLPPLPIGSRKRARASDTPKDRHARLPLLRLLCFAEPWRVGEAYDPPVASVDFRTLLELPAPVEISLSDLERRILESV